MTQQTHNHKHANTAEVIKELSDIITHVSNVKKWLKIMLIVLKSLKS